ncbi:hypothetical protein B0H17DRAFT_1228009 [Mycena rosella]|uniref:Uncharacterized protein n=1 Tax=Mycena rosella TaxID=1033263 RepID=A0AAD7GRS7_MYCRO|nr:hypothetical protein B0H17DRAFT_1228009 [Mycena rosella]
MYSEQPETSAPFLGRSGSEIGSPRFEKFGDTPQTVFPRHGGFRTRTLLYKLLFEWPGFIICGQLLLQGLGWSLVAVVEHCGYIALPYRMAAEAKVYPHLVILVSIMVSTGLAACSAFLFSFGVRRSIALRLRRPMSLAKLFFAVSISACSLVLNRRKWQWTLIWSTLLTPVDIVIETPVRSSELDLASPRLRQMASSGALDTCIYAGSYLAFFDVGRTESGSARAKHHLGYPASFTLMDNTFNISTGGVNMTAWLAVFAALVPTKDQPRSLQLYKAWTASLAGFRSTTPWFNNVWSPNPRIGPEPNLKHRVLRRRSL